MRNDNDNDLEIDDFVIPPPPPPVTPPDVGALVAGLPTPAWLVERAQTRADSPWSTWRCAAAGMVARLWHPARGADVAETMAVLSSECGTPAERAARWFASQAPEARAAVVDSCAWEVERLIDSLSALQRAVAAGEEIARQTARR